MVYITDMLIILINCLIWTIILQVIIFLHELGHAVVALIVTEGEVIIKLGNGKSGKYESLITGRIEFKFYPFQPFFGEVSCDTSKIKPRKRSLIFLGGPGMSLIIALVSFRISINMHQQLFYYIGICSLIGFIITFVPIKSPRVFFGYSNCVSDGYNILKCIRNT